MKNHIISHNIVNTYISFIPSTSLYEYVANYLKNEDKNAEILFILEDNPYYDE